MVVGQADDVETGVAVVCRVARRRTKQVTRIEVLALLRRFAAVHEHSLEVAEGDIGALQVGRHVGQEADAVVVGEVVLGQDALVKEGLPTRSGLKPRLRAPCPRARSASRRRRAARAPGRGERALR